MDTPDGILADAQRRMTLAVSALERDLDAIRVGAASGALIEGIRVDHGGHRLRLIELASVSIPDPRQIVIRPWDPSSLRAIGTAISHSRIGLTPTVDGGTIRLFVPALTGERREELATLVRQRAERARVDIRSIRHDGQHAIGAMGLGSDDARRVGARLQASTDRAVAEVDRLADEKTATIRRL